jgi:aspartyl-tRNA(Asn)/glutamyl-tRNA(Gln) amidotransferase subunit B
MSADPYTIVIGLEVHVQLLVESKLFCGCSTKFGLPPNTATCPVCIGMPGSLPVMNRRAFEYGLKAAVALNCEIARFTKWDRKNYYYPDLPKGYQISQFDLPFSSHGRLRISDPKGRIEPKDIGIIRAHLEEDAGKSMHDEVAGKADSRIDLNRTGTPLLEIVSEPDMRSPAEAKAYLTELKLLLNYLGVSDCNMQEGSLRVDANINLHIDTPQGKIATPIVEIKNMNSFRAVERALAYEAERQYRLWQETGKKKGDVAKQTRGWDDAAGVTKAQRSKESRATTATSPIPTWFRSPRLKSKSRRSAARWANCLPSFAHGWKRPTASRPTTATCWSTRVGRWWTTISNWPNSAATARRPATGCSRTCSAGSTSSSWKLPGIQCVRRRWLSC